MSRKERRYEDVRNRNTISRTLERISKEEKSAEYQQAQRLYGNSYRAQITIRGEKFLVYPAGSKCDIVKEKNVAAPLLNNGGNLNIVTVFNHLAMLCEI